MSKELLEDSDWSSRWGEFDKEMERMEKELSKAVKRTVETLNALYENAPNEHVTDDSKPFPVEIDNEPPPTVFKMLMPWQIKI